MKLKEDLAARVYEFATEKWGEVANGYVVPSPEDLTFGNTGRRLNACIFYADISGSTEMVNLLLDECAAEYYKAFLYCAAKIIKQNEGEITAYDGDRVMAVFLGPSKEKLAVCAAFNLGYAVSQIINPQFKSTYGENHRRLRHTIGIDTGTVLVSKTGVRIDSDLVWVGPPANYAAKLNSFLGLDHDYPIRITQEVYSELLLSQSCLLGNNNEDIWEGPFFDFEPRAHYRTAYQQAIT